MDMMDVLFAKVTEGGSSISVEPLSVTENGTYTAPTGIAYSPVEVAVPITPGPTPQVKGGVTFYDYDGTVVANYTKEQFLTLTELPANPTHERLISQGWNYSLEDAKAYVEKYGNLDIGQTYITASGALEIDIELHDGRLHPYLGLNINGSVTVDWGDGTTTDTMTGTNLSTICRKDHIYTAPGAYTIKVYADDGTSVAIVGSGNAYSNILTHSSNPSVSISPTMSYNSSIIRIYTANFVTNIGIYAFFGCSSLTSITIPNGITRIYNNTFGNCYLLTSITIPETVTKIDGYVFHDCYSLTSIMIPNSVTSIGDYAFYYCYSLASIIIPDSITSIVGTTFQNCYSLASVTIPDSVTSIGSTIFQKCYPLASITIPDSITSIGSSAFSYCHSLASIIIPNSVTKINNNTFEYCRALDSVTIPDSITSIGNSAFNSCYVLTSVTIPDSVTSIGSSAFSGCRSIGFIKFISQTPPTISSSNAWSDIPKDCIIYVPTGTIEAYKATANMPNPSTYTYVEYDLAT